MGPRVDTRCVMADEVYVKRCEAGGPFHKNMYERF